MVVVVVVEVVVVVVVVVVFVVHGSEVTFCSSLCELSGDVLATLWVEDSTTLCDRSRGHLFRTGTRVCVNIIELLCTTIIQRWSFAADSIHRSLFSGWVWLGSEKPIYQYVLLKMLCHYFIVSHSSHCMHYITYVFSSRTRRISCSTSPSLSCTLQTTTLL